MLTIQLYHQDILYYYPIQHTATACVPRYVLCYGPSVPTQRKGLGRDETLLQTTQPWRLSASWGTN